MPSCVSSNFADENELRFGQDRITVYGPFRQLASADGTSNTARVLLDQTVDWTNPGPNPVRAHVLFTRPPRYVRAQGPIRHFIEEKWAITTDGSAPVLPGSLITSFGGGVDRNQTNMWWQHLESPMTYMPPDIGQVVRNSGQMIRVRYQAALSISAAGGSSMNVQSYWHEVSIVTTPIPL